MYFIKYESCSVCNKLRRYCEGVTTPQNILCARNLNIERKEVLNVYSTRDSVCVSHRYTGCKLCCSTV